MSATIAARLRALEAVRARGYEGIVLVQHGESVEEAVARVQPKGPYVALPAKAPPVVVQMGPLDPEL